jgi:hypothetical protein
MAEVNSIERQNTSGNRSRNASRSFPPHLNRLYNSALSLIAGPFTELILAIWEPHRTHEYLSASDCRRHVWHSWLGSHGGHYIDTETYRLLSWSRSKDILADVYGWCPSGLISALGRLGAEARRREFYAALFEVLKRGGPLARHVQHLKQISDETIFAFAAINDHPPSDRILKILLKRSKPQNFTELAWIVGRLIHLMGESQVEKAISTGGNPGWTVQRLIGKLTFPVPPFSGDPRLQPITSAEELKVIGKTFRNCLTDSSTWFDAVIEVLAGRTYFYRWNGDQLAILSFGRLGSLGWIPLQFEGEKNDTPNEETQREVEQVLRQVPEVGPIGMRYRYRC